MDTLESTQLLVGITRVEDLEDKQDYAENKSRRNNLKLIGVPESSEEKTWDDTKPIVKDLVRKKLGIR